MRSSRLLVLAVLAVIGAAACGGSGGTPTTAPNATTTGGQPTAAGGGPTAPVGGEATKGPGVGTGDSCTALSLADIKTATGLDYPAGVADSTGQCAWEITTGTYNNLSLWFDTSTKFADIKAGFPGGTDTTIGGHPAYMGVSGTILQSLWVDLGSSVLSITIAPAPADAQAVVKKLAELALAKM